MREIRILKDLVGFNTVKDKENEKIINYLEKKLKYIGFETEYKGKYLIMSIGKDAKLGFVGHTDTVEYIDGWDTDPFELTEKDGKLYGLGSCDMKGGIASFISALQQMDLNQLKYGIKVYFTYDEEIGFSGIYDIVNSKMKFPPTLIIGEPTNNIMLTGGKGLLEYKLNFKGIKVHSSVPEKGKSANLNCIKFMNELDGFYTSKIKPDIEQIFEVPYTTMNIGIINGGSAANSLAAKCEATLDFRIAKNNHIKLLKDKIYNLSQKYDCEANLIEELEAWINRIDFIDELKTANFLTEASMIKGDRIILGPGPVTAHEVNEHVTIDSYLNVIEQYKNLIKKICCIK